MSSPLMTKKPLTAKCGEKIASKDEKAEILVSA
jgi:hypothetical protein